MPKARVYNPATSQWIYLDAQNADTIGGKSSNDFALISHNHDDKYYTKTQSDANYALKSHNHDIDYYKKSELNISGAGGSVHWNNISNKPSTFNPSTHNHDDIYYTETESDNKYLQKSDNLAALANKAAARTNLGLGTIATESSSSYALSNHNHDSIYIKGNGKITTSLAAPSSPTTNDIWIDLN